MQAAIEVTEYLFNRDSRDEAQNGLLALPANGGNWTNQTSRFELGKFSDEEKNVVDK